MEEKILIKSKADLKSKIIMISTVALSLFFGIVLLASIVGAESISHTSLYKSYFVIGHCLLLIGIVLVIMLVVYSKCELQITEKNVRGKTAFGKEVILPLYMVSSYSTRKFLSVIAVSTSSGVTKFWLIGNYREIGNVLSKKINERQDNTVRTPTVNTPMNPVNQVNQNNNLDDLKKLKELLDAGIISQEEFDAKKKQLLGL